MVFKKTPEQTLDYFVLSKERFGASFIRLSLPFKDTWMVWQGFNGKWTHQGPWRYSYDFVKVDNNQKTFANEGKMLADYYCFSQPVHSPIQGRIVQLRQVIFLNFKMGSISTLKD